MIMNEMRALCIGRWCWIGSCASKRSLEAGFKIRVHAMNGVPQLEVHVGARLLQRTRLLGPRDEEGGNATSENAHDERDHYIANETANKRKHNSFGNV